MKLNFEPNPWLTLDLRLSEVEVQAIAARGAVTGQIASRILEAVASECDTYVRELHAVRIPMRRCPRRRTA